LDGVEKKYKVSMAITSNADRAKTLFQIIKRKLLGSSISKPFIAGD
jgi:hypothetical protein